VRSRSFVFDGHEFVVRRGVFDPVRHLSGVAFADQLADVVTEWTPGARRALDVGTGSGLLAATMARLGLAVVATDIDAAAVNCAAQNCEGLDVDVRHGDMFGAVEAEMFDLIVVNPPYERAEPNWRKSVALTSSDFLEKLGARVHSFAPTVVVGFPANDAAALAASGLDLVTWRTVQTRGHALGLFVSTAPNPAVS